MPQKNMRRTGFSPAKKHAPHNPEAGFKRCAGTASIVI
jgi:hypothetical protein